MNPDGTTMRGEAIERFAEERGFPILTIAGLIAWRRFAFQNKNLVMPTVNHAFDRRQTNSSLPERFRSPVLD